MKINRKLKRMFNLYNIVIFGCIVIILISLYIIFKPENTEVQEVSNNVEIEIVKNDKNSGEITEDRARTIAKKQFKKLGEKNINKEDLQVKKIQRNGEEYYYISSAENTMEIQIKGGKIIRINSAVVDE